MIVAIRPILFKVTIHHHQVTNASIHVYLRNINITVLIMKIIPVQPVLLYVRVVMILRNVKVVLMDMSFLTMVHAYSTVHIISPLLYMFLYFVTVKLLVVILVRSMETNV